MIRLEGSKLWARMEHLAANTNRKSAAIAYVSDDSRIQFGEGDKLVVDASDEQIAAGATSADVLGRAVRRGAQVYSCPKLHAKLMVFDNTVVIGSTNVSRLSATELLEAGTVSDSPALVRSALSLIDTLVRGSEPVNKPFLARISKIRVKRSGTAGRFSDGQPTRVAKPTLFEAFENNSPHLNDFVFMLVEGGATLTSSGIRRVARKHQIRLPPSDLWDWYQFEAGKYFDHLFHRLFAVQGLKIVCLLVQSKGKRVQRAIELMPYSLVYVNHLHIGRSVAFNCIIDRRAPFKLDSKSGNAICGEFTHALEANPSLGRQLFRSRSWIFKPKTILRALQ